MIREQNTLLPGWAWTTLGEIAEIAGGGTPSRTIADFFTGDIVWLTPTEIPKDRVAVVFQSKEQITAEGLRRSSARLVPKGTVLMTSRASIGFVAVAGTEVTTNQGFANFICREGVYNFFLAYWLWSNADFFKEQATGTTFKEIIKSKLRTFLFPLPPLPEQRRIVAEIEKQFTRLDAGIAALKRVQANLKRYRASVLKAACEGRLAPQDPNDEPADRLLARIVAERRAKWEVDHPGKKYVEPTPPATDNLPALPIGWSYVHVSAIAEVRLGRQRSPARATGPDMRPYLRAANVTWNGLGLSDVKQMDFSPEEQKIYRLKRGDILLGEASGSISEVGKPAIWNDELNECYFQNTLIRVRSHGPLPAYLYTHFLYDAFSERFRSIAKGVGIHHLGAENLSNWIVSLPPLAEQERIAAEVARRLSVLQKLESTIAANLVRANRLRRAILHRAFSGRLVPQDPQDEPATEILARIKAERAKHEAEQQAAPRKRKPKEERMARAESQRRTIYDILSQAESSMTPESVFERTGLAIDQIEEFYQELRGESGKRVRVLRPNKAEVYLEAIKP